MCDKGVITADSICLVVQPVYIRLLCVCMCFSLHLTANILACTCVFIAPLYDLIRGNELGPLGQKGFKLGAWVLVMFMVFGPCPSKVVMHLTTQP